AVDHAAKYADLDGNLPAVQAPLQLGHDLVQVDSQPAAGWAGDQLRLAHAPLRRLQDVVGRLDLDLLVGQQADADGVADAVARDSAQAARRLGDAVGGLSGFGDADVRRVVGLLGIESVGLDGRDDIA